MNDLLALFLPFMLGVIVAVVAIFILRNRASDKRPPLKSRAPAPSLHAPHRFDVLDHVAEGIVLLNDDLRPLLLNAAAARMLGVQTSALPARLPSQEVLVIAKEARDSRREVDEILNLWFPTRSRLKTKAMPAGDNEGVLIVLQDVTEEHLAQQIRKEFVAHASHELKSPVAGLQTLAEAVRQAVDDDPSATVRFADRIVAEASRLGRLIGDLLDLSRLEDPTHLPEEPVLLSAIAQRELDSVQPGATAKEMSIRNGIDPDVWVRGDEQQLGLLVRNLLENAVRYTSDGGRISIDVTLDGSSVIVRVADTGIGIPSESQGRVFERFYRVDRARSRDRGGTGLGLAIVKHVAELHGGNVDVQSELGQGSVFTATLPAHPAPEQPLTSLAG